MITGRTKEEDDNRSLGIKGRDRINIASENPPSPPTATRPRRHIPRKRSPRSRPHIPLEKKSTISLELPKGWLCSKFRMAVYAISAPRETPEKNNIGFSRRYPNTRNMIPMVASSIPAMSGPDPDSTIWMDKETHKDDCTVMSNAIDSRDRDARGYWHQRNRHTQHDRNARHLKRQGSLFEQCMQRVYIIYSLIYQMIFPINEVWSSWAAIVVLFWMVRNTKFIFWPIGQIHLIDIMRVVWCKTKYYLQSIKIYASSPLYQSRMTNNVSHPVPIEDPHKFLENSSKEE